MRWLLLRIGLWFPISSRIVSKPSFGGLGQWQIFVFIVPIHQINFQIRNLFAPSVALLGQPAVADMCRQTEYAIRKRTAIFEVLGMKCAACGHRDDLHFAPGAIRVKIVLPVVTSNL